MSSCFFTLLDSVSKTPVAIGTISLSPRDAQVIIKKMKIVFFSTVILSLYLSAPNFPPPLPPPLQSASSADHATRKLPPPPLVIRHKRTSSEPSPYTPQKHTSLPEGKRVTRCIGKNASLVEQEHKTYETGPCNSDLAEIYWLRFLQTCRKALNMY